MRFNKLTIKQQNISDLMRYFKRKLPKIQVKVLWNSK